ncbi:uncharacterized protein Smp_203750 [Schistosoma mansoni]|uniref:uncharacterized protein n=1 Tax=Schistosoma mansoni TaxID=6183 RepID=UPI00022DCB83|nr:uncharacterized protein Smp_203750 [Schistosoma mansoni]|eukprot:XP_018655057.1 uncharacterized protein Smp_203750 [Schistosoma mansoni]
MSNEAHHLCIIHGYRNINITQEYTVSKVTTHCLKTKCNYIQWNHIIFLLSSRLINLSHSTVLDSLYSVCLVKKNKKKNEKFISQKNKKIKKYVNEKAI